MRLIHGGKNLARTLPLSTLKSNRLPFPETEPSETSQPPLLNKPSPEEPSFLDELVWIHCSVGDEIHEEEDEEEDTAEHVRGFYYIHERFLIDVVCRA